MILRLVGPKGRRLRDGKWCGEAADLGAEAQRKPCRAEQACEPRHSPTRPQGGAAPKKEK